MSKGGIELTVTISNFEEAKEKLSELEAQLDRVIEKQEKIAKWGAEKCLIKFMVRG